ncbi:MAG: hypothetical protein GY839_06415 [candidate division Zixibacteria bacterium]|nr:hypothetical protein [candidate division Zixibacteria bacterium]
MIIKALEKPKINYEKPTFTLDVNQVALRNPNSWPPEMDGLAQLEYNYFGPQTIELCVTPRTPEEIKYGIPIDQLGDSAYRRFQKSKLFKLRPDDTLLTLKGQEANVLWNGIRFILFPSVDDTHLNPNQRSDIDQIFFHTTASGSLENSAFVTTDNNFHAHKNELKSELGIEIANPAGIWSEYSSYDNIVNPSQDDIDDLIKGQKDYLIKLQKEANS